MLPSTFNFILNEISNKLIRTTDENKMIPPDKLLSLWHNLIFKSIKQFNFWHFYSETDQNCVEKNLLCTAKINVTSTTRYFPRFSLFKKSFSRTTSPAVALKASWKQKSMTSYVLLRYFKVPNGPIKVTLYNSKHL